jgi:hypothetical protein
VTVDQPLLAVGVRFPLCPHEFRERLRERSLDAQRPNLVFRTERSRRRLTDDYESGASTLKTSSPSRRPARSSSRDSNELGTANERLEQLRDELSSQGRTFDVGEFFLEVRDREPSGCPTPKPASPGCTVPLLVDAWPKDQARSRLDRSSSVEGRRRGS